jgi:hypothetical protein
MATEFLKDIWDTDGCLGIPMKDRQAQLELERAGCSDFHPGCDDESQAAILRHPSMTPAADLGNPPPRWDNWVAPHPQERGAVASNNVEHVTHADFLVQLQARGVAFDRVDLASWLDAVWPLVERRQDAALWAREYLAACRGRGTALR